MAQAAATQEGTSLFGNDTLYGITAWSVVFAPDARTGKERWEWDPQNDQPTHAALGWAP